MTTAEFLAEQAEKKRWEDAPKVNLDMADYEAQALYALLGHINWYQIMDVLTDKRSADEAETAHRDIFHVTMRLDRLLERDK